MARKYDDTTAKPTNDAYTGMLALSFLALLIGSTFLYIQVNQYSDTTPGPAHRKAEPPPPAMSETGEKPAPKDVPDDADKVDKGDKADKGDKGDKGDDKGDKGDK
jgi:hypothetical protein